MKFGLNTGLRLAMFLAQVREETGSELKVIRENLNYSEEALPKLYKAFNDRLADKYGRNEEHKANQEAIANIAYANRLGNSAADSDGDGSVGGGCTIKWLPSFAPDKLFIVRGNATSNIYSYDLVTNTFATAAFHPSTETFTTASTHTARSIGNKGYSIISSKDATMRIYEYDPSLSRLHPKMNQWLYPFGGSVQGDTASCMRSPDEVEFYYLLLHSSTGFVRCALIDS